MKAMSCYRYLSPRCGGAIALLVLIFASRHCTAEGLDRVWTDRSGEFKQKAKLIGFQGDRVWLRQDKGGDTVIKINDLSEKDRAFALAILACEQSATQFERIAEHNPRMPSSPAAVAEIFDSLDKASEGGFAAALYAGTLNAYSRDPRRVSEAKRELDKAIKVLREVRKAIPDAHEQTLACALNNRAVLWLREGNPKKAGDLFAEAAAISDRVSFPVYHNATLLIDISAHFGKQAKFSEAQRQKLTKTIATASPDTPNAKIPKRFVYTLSHDPIQSFIRAASKPAHKNGGTAGKNATETSAPHKITPGYVQLGNGSGFLISPRLVLTNRHVVEENRDNKQFLLCNETTLKNGVVGTVVKVSTEEDTDLALIRLAEENEGVSGIALRPDLPDQGEEFVVLGYPMIWAFGETLNASRGIVSSVVKDGHNVVHDATTNPGNSGGPCLDSCGNAIGVHFAGGVGEGEGRNFAVSIPAALKFLDGTDFEGVAVREKTLKPAEVIAGAKDSVVRVEVYGKPTLAISGGDDSLKETGNQALDQIITLAKLGLWPELTCMDCRGSGFISCPMCSNGVVSDHREVTAFIDPVSGRPVNQKRVFKVACPKCNGNGGFPCRSCKNGALSLFTE